MPNRFAASDRFTLLDCLDLELCRVLPIRNQLLPAHIALHSSEIYAQSDVRETRAGSLIQSAGKSLLWSHHISLIFLDGHAKAHVDSCYELRFPEIVANHTRASYFEGS